MYYMISLYEMSRIGESIETGNRAMVFLKLGDNRDC